LKMYLATFSHIVESSAVTLIKREMTILPSVSSG
jgi:hypothetical protein